MVQNDFTISRTYSFEFIDANGAEEHTISVAGNFTHSSLMPVEGDLTVVMNGTGIQTVTNSGAGDIGGLRISNTSATVSLWISMM